MKNAILEDKTPNLFLLHYALSNLAVLNLLLIPHFAFSLSLLEKRAPLSANARRAGWVGCNFLLDRIPSDAKTAIVRSGRIVSPRDVRGAFRKIRSLERLPIENRGWTLDVLNVVRSLRKDKFVLSEVYAHADSLSELHPQNRHVRDKIRQQLQVLRDLGFLEFLGGGSYRFV